jgi:stringent starvation protein A
MTVITSKRSVMALYSAPTDPYSHQVRIVLAEKGVTVDIIGVQPDSRPEDLIDINPYGTVPTLVDRDLVLYSAGIIMEYLDERFPHPPLLPVYPVARGRSRLMMYRIDRDWYTLMNRIMHESGKEADQARQILRDSLMSVLPVFNEMPFFLSEEFSLVDCCIAPLLWRLPSLGVDLPAQAKDIDAYAKRIFERDSFQVSLTEAERALR